MSHVVNSECYSVYSRGQPFTCTLVWLARPPRLEGRPSIVATPDKATIPVGASSYIMSLAVHTDTSSKFPLQVHLPLKTAMTIFIWETGQLSEGLYSVISYLRTLDSVRVFIKGVVRGHACYNVAHVSASNVIRPRAGDAPRSSSPELIGPQN